MKKRLMLLVASLALLGVLPGCGPRMAHHMARHMAGAAIAGAVIAGTAVAVAHHHNHWHDDHCGCHREWHHGRWVYHYDGHWEYYDHETRSWYRYH